MKITIPEEIARMQRACQLPGETRYSSGDSMAGICLRGTRAYATNGSIAVIRSGLPCVPTPVVIRLAVPGRWWLGDEAEVTLPDEMPEEWASVAVLTSRNRAIRVDYRSADDYPDVAAVVPAERWVSRLVSLTPEYVATLAAAMGVRPRQGLQILRDERVDTLDLQGYGADGIEAARLCRGLLVRPESANNSVTGIMMPRRW